MTERMWLMSPLPWFCAKCGEKEVLSFRITPAGTREYSCNKCHFQHFADGNKTYEVTWDGHLQRGLISEERHGG